MIYIETSEKDVKRPVKLIALKYIDALVALEGKIGDISTPWMICGDLGEAIRTVDVDPERIEIITTKEGAQEIFIRVKDFHPSDIEFKVECLPRKALVEQKEYPIKIRSYNFDFQVNDVPVKVYGDLQLQIDNWDWGDKISISSDYVSVVGHNISVMPLDSKLDLYAGLGWVDRANKILNVLQRTRH